MSARVKIRLAGLAKSFGDKRVLAGVDLAVETGESVVIIGPSGCGKSVMLKCILGLIEPDAGRVEIDGTDVSPLEGAAREAVNRRIGMLFQGAALFDSLTVWENVAFGLMQGEKRLTRPAAQERAIDTLGQVGLGPEVAEMHPADLSGGMKKRVGLARAIAAQPEILFFDEPTTGLDPIMSDVINELIVKCVRKLGATAITITHDMTSARKIADRIVMLYDGRAVWHGPPAIVENSGNPYVDQFVRGRAAGPIKMAVRA
jgi:phospholipid/cholesterol/gamma-HCH transport system ATP-binding protein